MSGHTRGPWGVEQTRDMLWVGPLRPDGHKVDEVVVGLTIDRELTVTAALRQHRNTLLIAAAPDLLEALEEVRRVGDDKMAFKSEWVAAVAKADAAIAKAKGEA